MKLTNKHIRHLKSLAHAKKPVVTIGNNGLTPSVHKEIHNALDFHELIKIKLPAILKADKMDLTNIICKNSDATSIGLTGRTAIIFRPLVSGKSKIDLSD